MFIAGIVMMFKNPELLVIGTVLLTHLYTHFKAPPFKAAINSKQIFRCGIAASCMQFLQLQYQKNPAFNSNLFQFEAGKKNMPVLPNRTTTNNIIKVCQKNRPFDTP